MVPLLTVILWAFGGKLSPHAGNCFPSSCPSSWDVSAPCPLGPPVPGNSKPDDPASTTNYFTSCSQQALVLGQWVSLWLHGWVPNNAGTGSHLRHEAFWGPGRTLRGSYIHKESVIPRTACSAKPPALLGHIAGLSVELPRWKGTQYPVHCLEAPKESSMTPADVSPLIFRNCDRFRDTCPYFHSLQAWAFCKSLCMAFMGARGWWKSFFERNTLSLLPSHCPTKSLGFLAAGHEVSFYKGDKASTQQREGDMMEIPRWMSKGAN